MELNKWVSNNPDLLNDSKTEEYIFISNQPTVKALGLLWRPSSDCFNFKLSEQFYKREILSSITRLFDPLGLVSPVITKTKTFLQEIWKNKLDWDDHIPSSELKVWLKFLKQLPEINKLEIPRFILMPEAIIIDLHGFCDASEKAFGAVIYIVSKATDGAVKTSLLCSKSRVCPIKALTIPRLELSAALLLARLVAKLLVILQIQFNGIYLWSDSTIVLA
ncbi:uncharacterized protein LOC118181675 [Stegodyphus dumicola]|uniref:uncharacterized protein LOC118181675 n=1 Tax=Stegodyphus dumicola TaxID=202533 RepID=UPI0015AD780B|nr:uncharacterized protein LOC118181675 [Stegodyphus dumicola]